MTDLMMMDGLIRSNRDFNLSLISATLYPEQYTTRDVKFATFSFFPIPPFFFFHNTTVFYTTFTAKPIIHLVIEGNSRKVIKPAIVVSC